MRAAVIPLDEIHEHPSNVREDLGDIVELRELDQGRRAP